MNGSLDIRSTGSMEVDGVIGIDTADKNVVLEAQGAASDLNVNNNVSVSGTGTIDLTAGQNIQIAQNTDATVTAVDGDVTISAVNVTIGDTTNNVDGIVTTAGATAAGLGNIKITATGAVTMEDAAGNDTTKIDAGGYLAIDPTTVTIDEAGLEADEYISIVASGEVTLNGDVVTTDDNSYVTIDAGNIIQAFNITTPTGGGSEYVTLTADTTITDYQQTSRLISVL